MAEKPKYILEKHPFEDFVLADTKILIIGTFPTKKQNRQYEFYYAGKTSHFWSIIQKIFLVSFQELKGEKAVNERIRFASKNKIGFTDMLEECYRHDNSSSDSALYPVRIKDIDSLILLYPSIKTIVFTSRTDAVGALGLFKTSLYLKGKTPLKVDEFKNIKESTYFIANREIEILVPYAPTDRVITRKGLEIVTKMYGYALNGLEI